MNNDNIKQLRNETGISVMQCKKALEEAGGDMEQARILLRKESANIAEKKSDRELGAGVVASYVHAGAQIGVLIELFCESDFVAKNTEFVSLANDIAMHVAAMKPRWVNSNDITDDERDQARKSFQSDIDAMDDKSEDIKEKIMQGKLDTFFDEATLMKQTFVKDPNVTVEGLINQATQKLGERIQVGTITRLAI